MKAEIISIGDELLIGQVINTNASWLAERLNSIGISVQQISVVSDNRQHIINSLNEAKGRADIIITTGGIGPTNDDITKTTFCEYFNTKLVFNEEAYKDIETLFKNRGVEVTELNRKQAEIPEKCKPLKNKNGTAPGMWFEEEGKIYISLPGVPFEMKAITSEYILPRLAELSGKTIYHKTILTQGMGESFLSEKIKDWEARLPEHIKLAYLPSPGIVRLRLTAAGSQQSAEGIRQEVDKLIEELNEIIPDLIYGYDDDTLEAIIGKILTKKRSYLATAESCTGGYIAHRITSVPGSSKYFLGSVVAYANDIKEGILKVRNVNFKKNGAVSEEVVKAMAEGIKGLFASSYAIATSGIAGPDGGTAEKPVGTTWIAIATPEKTIAQKFMLGDNRERNIVRASLTALNMLRKVLIEKR